VLVAWHWQYKLCPHAILSTTNPTQTGLVLNPGLHGDKLPKPWQGLLGSKFSILYKEHKISRPDLRPNNIPNQCVPGVLPLRQSGQRMKWQRTSLQW
jgi:hypothetical protein